MRVPATLVIASSLLLAAAPVAAADGLGDDLQETTRGLDTGSDEPPARPQDEPARPAQAGDDEPEVSGEPLVGLFELEPGDCDGPSGTHFRMVQPQGEPGEGPYVANGDSPCDDDTVTPLEPGTDGGLSTREHQPHPDQAFDVDGSGQAERITVPQEFFGVDFAVATNPTDPQTGIDTPEPVIAHDGDGGLDGDVRAFGVAWNRQHFNQGAPKPDGGTQGQTSTPTGTYDPDTGGFSLAWTSEIEGGPFDGFTGEWHLEGTFVPADGTPADGAGTQDGPGGQADATERADGSTGDGGPSTPSPDAGAATDDGTAQDGAPAEGDVAGARPSGDRATPRTGAGATPLAGLTLLALGALLRRARRRPDPTDARGTP